MANSGLQHKIEVEVKHTGVLKTEIPYSRDKTHSQNNRLNFFIATMYSSSMEALFCVNNETLSVSQVQTHSSAGSDSE